MSRGMHNGCHQVRGYIGLSDQNILLTNRNITLRCHQLLVNYTKISWDEWQNQPRDLDAIEWDVADTKLLINSEGCGYPPRVNCTEFAKEYG